jgi:hypothetical protein
MDSGCLTTLTSLARTTENRPIQNAINISHTIGYCLGFTLNINDLLVMSKIGEYSREYRMGLGCLITSTTLEQRTRNRSKLQIHVCMYPIPQYFTLNYRVKHYNCARSRSKIKEIDGDAGSGSKKLQSQHRSVRGRP